MYKIKNRRAIVIGCDNALLHQAIVDSIRHVCVMKAETPKRASEEKQLKLTARKHITHKIFKDSDADTLEYKHKKHKKNRWT